MKVILAALVGSLLTVWNVAIASHDPLHALSDEFDQSASIANWQRIFQTEGWVANQLEAWHVDDPRAPGEMVLMPYSSSWFRDLRGVLAYKNITGDFIVTTRLTLFSRHDSVDPLSSPTSEPPNVRFSLAGILARNPTGITQGAPLPYSSSAQAIGAGGSDWTADLENYIFLSYGAADIPNTWQYEVKTTINGNSIKYHLSRGVPNSGEVWLQMVRVGDTFMVLRKHPGGDWIIENRYIRADFDETIQVGFTTYTDWDRISTFNSPEADSFHHNYLVIDDASAHPDLVVHADYMRFERPHADLTEGLMSAAGVDEEAGNVPVAVTPLALLSASAVAPYLGDNANHAPNIAPDDSGLCFPIGRKQTGFSVVCF